MIDGVARQPGRSLSSLISGAVGDVSGPSRIASFTIVLALAAATLAMVLLPAEPPARRPFGLPWPILAALFYVAEAKVVHLHIGRSAHSFSMSEIPMMIGLFLLAPPEFILARVVGSGLALYLARRQRGTKLAFNLAQFALCAVVSVAIVHLASTSAEALGPALWVAALVSTLVDNVIGVLAVSTAISLAEGTPHYRRLPEMLRLAMLVSLTNATLALIGLTFVWEASAAVWLLVLPAVSAAVAYRTYIGERQRHQALEMLHESTLILQRNPHLDAALVALLEHARKMFRATVAEISVLPQRNGGEIVRVRVGPGDAVIHMEPMGPTLVDPLLRAAVADDAARIVDSTDVADDVHTRRGWRTALVGPLRGESRLVGTLVVADRLSQISSFDEDDLRLFETLANHTAISLENGQLEQSLAQLSELKEELGHQACHDALTGLANRTLFADVVAERLSTPTAEGLVPVVLFLDLDDFKLVNDTLGHAAGDNLLVRVAERITSTLRATDVAARLGGDEFAVLLWDSPDLLASIQVADRLSATFGPEIEFADGHIAVKASIGVAGGRPGLDTAGELLRNADVAMYSAKARGKGRVVVFEPSMHEAVVERARLSGDLGRAAKAGELVLQYQPIVDLDSGRMTGAEALVRWAHPERGLLRPDEFVPVAEESEAIHDIGRWVLTEACRQARAWQELFPATPFTISVNISAKQLALPGFADEVREIIKSTGVDPKRIVLEMTETAMLKDSESVQEKLGHLRRTGLGISVDDFGTGYSSLSYLQRFPVTALKIARDFVDVTGSDPEQWELASAIVALGRALNLTVIAEGVERRSQLRRLRALGCESAQGFYFARPLSPAALQALLERGGELIERRDVTIDLRARASRGSATLPASSQPSESQDERTLAVPQPSGVGR